MAGPIKIAIVADAGKATAGVTRFADDVNTSVNRAAGSLERAGRATRQAGEDTGEGFDRARDGADELDTKAMGFRDTMTGVQDSMAGVSAIAKGDLFTGFFTLGMGVGDLASGFANFLIPMAKQAALAMKALSLSMLTNPVFLIIAAIIALVAAIVIAYKKSETFRRIVDGAFRWVWTTIQGVWGWIKRNWPLLLAIITGPIGIAVRWVVTHFDEIKKKVQGIPKTVKDAFSKAKDWLVDAGKNVVKGLWDGIKGMGQWLKDTLIGWAKSTIPGPIAKALGIASPSKVAMELGGRFGQGLGIGLDQTRASVQRAAGRLAAATVATPPGGGPGGTQGRAGGDPVRLVVDANDNEVSRFLGRMLQEYVRVQGRGNVQVALGTR
jgi:hypothetical protein